MVFGGVQSGGDLGVGFFGGALLEGVFVLGFFFFFFFFFFFSLLLVDGEMGWGGRKSEMGERGQSADMMQIFDQGNKRFGVVQRKF